MFCSGCKWRFAFEINRIKSTFSPLQLSVKDLQDTIKYMHDNKKYKKVCAVDVFRPVTHFITDLHIVGHAHEPMMQLTGFCARTQMVFYIEACESGSMMTQLPDDIDGEQKFNSSAKVNKNKR